MTKEEFNWFWKDTTKEGVLNQFYYEHIQLREEIERIQKAIDIIKKYNLGKYDYSIPTIGIIELLEILKDED